MTAEQGDEDDKFFLKNCVVDELLTQSRHRDVTRCQLSGTGRDILVPSILENNDMIQAHNSVANDDMRASSARR